MHHRDGRGKGPRKPAKKEVTLEFLLTFYEYFLREYEITKIAASLDTSVAVLNSWCKKFPELQTARELAVKRRKETNTFSGYVYKHLSPEAKKVWEKIQFWEDSSSTSDKINQILSQSPTKLRQEIFVHALIHYGFNLSEACRLAGVSRSTVEAWKRDDMSFLQMLEEIEWHKKNYFEHALVDLVSIRNPGAVMFVNRSKNADRGYAEKTTVEHTGEVAIGFKMDDMIDTISLAARKEILNAIRVEKKRRLEEENKKRALIADADTIEV